MSMLFRVLAALRLVAKHACILIVGLDNSGKTTILEQLKPKSQQHVEIVPTIGFSVDSFTREGVKFKVFDMSGAGKYRKLWEKYYKETDAVVFVIDSSDKLRLAVAKEELCSMLVHKDLKRCPVLFFANKQDVDHSLAPGEIAEELSLHLIEDRPWQIMPTNALKGEGLDSVYCEPVDASKRAILAIPSGDTT